MAILFFGGCWRHAAVCLPHSGVMTFPSPSKLATQKRF